MAERTGLCRAARPLLGAVCALLLACSSSPAPSHGTTGGSTASGGTTSGGTTSGGATSGGATSGGATSGGATSGGTNTSATGGAEPEGGAPSAGANAAGNAGSTGASADPSCALMARGVAIHASWDPLGYPLYALDGCNLAYVAPDGSLHWRELTTVDDRVLDGPENVPRRPTLKADVMAWEVVLDGRSQVRVRTKSGTTTLTGRFDHAAEPKAARDAVVFTAFSAQSPNSDSDVFLYDVASETASVALGGPGQQRFADVSPEFVAASDFSEDPQGYFDEASSAADIVLLSRTDGSVTLRPKPGKQAFPMLGADGLLAYLHWGDVHPEPKFSAFGLFVARADSTPESDTLVRDIHTDPSYIRPSVRGTVVDFIDATGGITTLYRAPLSPLGEPVVGAQGNAAESLLGPAGTESFTVVGKRLAGGSLLEVWAR
jgi:hypothetical protein